MAAHVLIVDDQALNRILLSQMLKDEGYQVSMAFNGQEAIKVLEHEPIDIVLLDVIMPVMDGFETAKIIKNNHSDVYLPLSLIHI